MFRASPCATAVAVVCFAAAPSPAFDTGHLYGASGDSVAPGRGLLALAPGDPAAPDLVVFTTRSSDEFAVANRSANSPRSDTDSLVLNGRSEPAGLGFSPSALSMSPAERGPLGLALLFGSWLLVRRRMTAVF